MTGSKADILNELQKQILPLQGYRRVSNVSGFKSGLGTILNSFPNKNFPLGAIHEFITDSTESTASTTGFIAGLNSLLMGSTGVIVWITTSNNLFPPSFIHFNIDPANIIFVEIKDEKEILWATEEALRCEALTAVVTNIPNISFTASRRLQLAVEKSMVTGFVIHPAKSQHNTSSCVSRWKINPVKSYASDIPGVGFPQWKVELLKVRNGQPGNWIVQWVDGKFLHTYGNTFIISDRVQKAG
jgi:protein ImuA